MKLEAGQLVRIERNLHGHGFGIGEIVRVAGYHEEGFPNYKGYRLTEPYLISKKWFEAEEVSVVEGNNEDYAWILRERE